MEKKSYYSGIFYTLISSMGLAFMGLFAKLGGGKLTLTALIFWRYLAALFFCFLLLVILKKFHGVMAHFQKRRMHFLRAFFAMGAQYCFFYYIGKESLLDAAVLINTGPLFIPLFEKFFLKREIETSIWWGVLLSFIGIILVLQPDRGIFTGLSLIGLMAGVFQGASQTVFGINAQEERAELGVFYLFLLCSFFSFFPYLYEHETFVSSSTPDWIFGIILALGLNSVINQWFRAEAYKHSTPARLSAFLYASVPVAGLLDWGVFGNIPNALSIWGALLVVSGGMLKIYFSTTKR